MNEPVVALLTQHRGGRSVWRFVMATATVQRPPTDGEVRAIVEARLDAPEGRSGTRPGPVRGDITALIEDVAQWLMHPAWYTLEANAYDAGPEIAPRDTDGHPPLWMDLRTSEARRLEQLVEDAIERAAQRCEAIIIEELTGAGAAFAGEFPEAPRP
jgi:hypothetical protein